MENNTIQEGLRQTVIKTITKAELASTIGTSRSKTLSTSALILFIEKTIFSLINPYLTEEETSVSSEINIKHFRAAKENETIRCTVHLKYVENNKLFFDVAVFDVAHNEIAIGAHSRRIIKLKKET
jgi:predicted thioesterase